MRAVAEDAPPTDSAAFILKCTRDCNLACAYCGDRRAAPRQLDFDLMLKTTREALDTFARVDFIFHGGEPLLLGIDYFRKALTVQRLLAAGDGRVRNILQTNGILIDREWCDFFRDEPIHVGVSVDGPARVHDAYRTYPGGRPSFEDSARGVRMLREHGVGRYGILAVASDAMLMEDGDAMLGFFAECLDVDGIETPDYREVSLMPERPRSTRFASVEAARRFYDKRQRYAEFMCATYSGLLRRDLTTIRVREITGKLDSLVGGKSRVCTEGGPCVGKYFGIDSSGIAAHCDSFFDDPRFCFGTIGTETMSDILASRVFHQAVELERRLRAACEPCRWYRHCQGGCLYEAVLFDASGLVDRPSFCPSRKIYDFIGEDLSRRHVPLA